MKRGLTHGLVFGLRKVRPNISRKEIQNHFITQMSGFT
jgi:hypothetical protein